MAITFTKLHQFKTASPMFGGYQAASIFFWFRYEQGGSSDSAVVGSFVAVGGLYGADWFTIVGGGPPGFIAMNFMFFSVWNQVFNRPIGVIQPVMMTFAQGQQLLYLSDMTISFGYNATGSTSASQPFTIGENGNSGVSAYTLGEINFWGGYTATQADYNALAAGTNPTMIGASATARYRWTLAGPIGQTPAIGDPGLTNTYGGTNDFASVNGSGPSFYTPLLSSSSSTRKKMLKFGGLLKYWKGSRYTP